MAGALFKGLMLAGKGILFVGRALLTTPIGLLITGIAVGSFLIYQYWEPISAWFRKKWAAVSSIFSSAWTGISNYCSEAWANITNFFGSSIGNITATILNWSPLGLFQQVFSTVLSWFGIDLPSKFTEFGSNLINGLVNGIRNAWDGAKEWVISLGQSIKGWFTGEMKIHSPSRVFKDYGVNLVEGLAIGMNKSLPMAEDASDNLSSAVGLNGVSHNTGLLTNYQPLNRAEVMSSETTQAQGITVHFSPTIQLNGNQGKDDILNDLQQGLNMTLTELKRLIIDTVNRENDQYRRRAY